MVLGVPTVRSRSRVVLGFDEKSRVTTQGGLHDELRQTVGVHCLPHLCDCIIMDVVVYGSKGETQILYG